MVESKSMSPIIRDGGDVTPFPRNQILVGDVREMLRTLPDESVHMVCTSPPYWGLRDYGTASWLGGDAVCDHVQSRALKRDTNGGLPPAGEGTRGTQSSTASSVIAYRETCGKCGATRIDAIVPEVPVEFWYAMDLALMPIADALLVLDGWTESRGTQAEMVEWAKTGKPLFYNEHDREMLLEWAHP